jgi:hypothetical protein
MVFDAQNGNLELIAFGCAVGISDRQDAVARLEA